MILSLDYSYSHSLANFLFQESDYFMNLENPVDGFIFHVESTTII
jgi:hypothetical protein